MKNILSRDFNSILGMITCCFLLILILSSCVFSKFGNVTCDYKDPKEISLCEINNKLNEAISKKDWEVIYSLKLEAQNNGIGSVETKKEFIKQCERVSAGGSFNIKMISLKIDGDDAETKNYIESRLFFWPFKTYPDTSIHYWRYSKDKWFLTDWDRRPKWE